MEWFVSHKEELALLMIRVILGMLFLFQGYDKLFEVGIAATTNAIFDAMKNRIPKSFVRFSVIASSAIELSGGLLLLLGLCTYPVVTLLGIHIILVSTAMSFREALWDMRFVLPRLILILLVLLLPDSWNLFSLDHLLYSCITSR